MMKDLAGQPRASRPSSGKSPRAIAVFEPDGLHRTLGAIGRLEAVISLTGLASNRRWLRFAGTGRAREACYYN